MRYSESIYELVSSVCYAIIQWTEMTHDFRGHTQQADELLGQLKEWVQTINSEHSTRILKSLKRAEQSIPDSKLIDSLNLNSHTHQEANSSSGVSQLVQTMDPVLMADQLTLIEYHLQKKISSAEFMKQAWNKREEKAPNIRAYIAWFNKVSRLLLFKSDKQIGEQLDFHRSYKRKNS